MFAKNPSTKALPREGCAVSVTDDCSVCFMRPMMPRPAIKSPPEICKMSLRVGEVAMSGPRPNMQAREYINTGAERPAAQARVRVRELLAPRLLRNTNASAGPGETSVRKCTTPKITVRFKKRLSNILNLKKRCSTIAPKCF